ncbi:MULTISPECIES: hypothetical protein [Paenibacillus]|nr:MULTISPECIES: hypothetical protein [Paenibacillus]AUS27063.1 hypothetical protein C1A50_2896 [Paenibacillus polymyxa]MEB4781659.1 hypothetical protein [Paenibacillus jamilae]WOZ36426.1 hypothetical protein RQP19_13640 [Paenibacillus polymyxa]
MRTRLFFHPWSIFKIEINIFTEEETFVSGSITTIVSMNIV